jgi:hypothetical protein
MIPTITARLAAFVALKSVRLAVILSGWAFAAALAFVTYADLRIEGPFGIGIGYEGWKPYGERMEQERDAALATIAKVEVEQKEAERRDKEQRAAAELKYRQIAEETQNEIEHLQARADRAFRDFASHARLRAEGDRGPGGAIIAPAESGGSAILADMPTDSLVAVGYVDLQACNDLAVYAMTAHFFGLRLEAQNRENDAALSIAPVGGQ